MEVKVLWSGQTKTKTIGSRLKTTVTVKVSSFFYAPEASGRVLL